jgi:iron complex transport system ATP-binding protein
MLQVQDLSYFIQSKCILKDINFSVKKNTITCILGPNGAGKTSLLKQICGLHKLEHGKIILDDQVLNSINETQRARKIAYVPQKSSSLPAFSVKEFIQQASYSHIEQQIVPDIKDILKVCELEAIENQSISSLSGGEMQRTLFASSLYQASPLVLLDEVTAGLDPAHHDSICKLIHKTRESHQLTYLWVTHDINSALQYADRILILKNSELIYDASPAPLIDGTFLSQVFDKKFKTLTDDQGQKYLI